MKKQLLLSLLFFSTFLKIQSQIAGSFTVPGSFPTLAAAINTLNLTGVAGAVTINVTAGYTETVPVGGLKLINPPGSSTTTILFTKLGSGANPLLLAYAGGTATSNSVKKDGIWMFAGCRNMTVDAIDLFDPNAVSPATMEFGYGFFKTTSAGCINNIIRNCSITMATPNSNNSRGIELSVNNFTANTTTVASSSTVLTNSYNKFYNNLIKKCDVGIWMFGNTSSFPDVGNDVGGLSAVTGNTIVNFGGSTSAAMGVYAGNQYTLNASYNLINNNDGSGLTAANGVRGIDMSGTEATINSNTISLQSTGGASGGALIGISQDGYSANTGTSNINNNIFPLLTYSNNSTAVSHSVIATDGNRVTNIMNNQIGNFAANEGTVTLISAVVGYTAFITNNIISGATIASKGIITGIQCSTTYSQNISNNSITNLQGTQGVGSASFTIVNGIKCPNGATITIADNTVTDLYGYSLYGISLTSTSSAASFSIANNKVKNLTVAPTTTVGANPNGIFAYISSTTTGVMAIRNNTVSDLTGIKNGNLTTGGQVRGILSSGAANTYVSNNKLCDMTTNGSGGLTAMTMGGAQNHIYNNLIGSININSGGNFFAMELSQAGTSRLYYNTIYMNTSTSTHTAGTTLISSINSSALELRNNILTNASTGPGFPAIFTTNNYVTTSNNNAFYFGTNINGHIQRNAATSTVLANFQAAYNSDAQSFVENPNFVSTVGSSPNFLNINTTIPTQIESGAAAISTITTDYIGTPRSGAPDVGAWEGNYTMADAVSPGLVSSGFTGPPCNGTTRTFTANLSDLSGVASGSLSPRLYYRVNFNLYTSTQGTLTSGTAANGIWTFALNYSAVTNDIIFYFLVAQDISYLNNVKVIPATSAVVTDVNNVSVPPSPANNYTIQTNPTISLTVSSATICNGQLFTIQASGAGSYSYSPGGFSTVSPTASTIYSVTGASSLGCPSTNTVTLSLSVAPLPTVTVNSGSICAGQSFTLLPNGANSYTYQGGSAIVTPASTTNYTVAGAAANGCTNFASANVTVVAPSLTVTAVQNTVCIGEPISVSVSGAINYTWQPVPQAGATYAGILNATTILTVTGADANGCQSTANITLVADPCTGLAELKNQSLQIGPNPSNGNLYINQNGKANALLVTIKDLSGRIIMQHTTQLELSYIDLSVFADGVYVVEVFADDALLSRSKLILAHQ